jgi:hypothetical protein
MVDESLVAYLMEHTKELHLKVVEGDSVVVDSSCFETRLRDVLSYSEKCQSSNCKTDGSASVYIEAVFDGMRCKHPVTHVFAQINSELILRGLCTL